MRRYTDEQLSRILSEHDAGRMRQGGIGGGTYTSSPQCVSEVAERRETDDVMNMITSWFDQEYSKRWTVDEFLAELEKQGLA